MQTIGEITTYLEALAPKSYQESYDNIGLLTGHPSTKLTGVLTTLDCTEDVVNEAIDNNCNLIVAHHPIVFTGLKKITGATYVERVIIKAIKNDIAIYAIHTNLDHMAHGVNKQFCDLLELQKTYIMAPKQGIIQSLTIKVPFSHLEAVQSSIWNAGGGEIGLYNQCSFTIKGIGEFTPMLGAQPAEGQVGKHSKEGEYQLEVLVPDFLASNVLRAVKEAHPYEEISYFLMDTKNPHNSVGMGMVGQLKAPMETHDFLAFLKKKMGLTAFKHTALCKNKIHTVAVCGGSGSSLLSKAKSCKADIYISSDFKYHEFFDADNQIIICDIGHYESEIATKDLLCQSIQEKFTNIAVRSSKSGSNPIQYYI